MPEISTLLTNTAVESLVQQYRTTQRRYLVPLENKKTQLTARLSVLAELKTKLSVLHTSAGSLAQEGDLSPLRIFSVTSSSPGTVSGTATVSAERGSHTVLVTQLAKQDTVLSDALSRTSTSIVDAEGSGTKELAVVINGRSTSITVELQQGQSNETVLSNIARAMNASNAGVRASVVNVSATTARLVITAEESGSSNAVSLADVNGTLLDSIGLTDAIVSGRTASNETTAGFVYASTSQLDAQFTLDGIAMRRESNTVSDALSGVTLELKGTQSASDPPVVLSVALDREQIKNTLEVFLKRYNEALSFLQAKTAVDATQGRREILAGDLIFQRLKNDLRVLVAREVGGIPPEDPNLLDEIGITAGSDGTLRLTDTGKFYEALSDGGDKIIALFASADGVATRLKAKLDGFVSTGGIVDTARTGTDTQISTVKSRMSRVETLVNRRVGRFQEEMVKLQAAVAQATQQQQRIQSMLSGGIVI